MELSPGFEGLPAGTSLLEGTPPSRDEIEAQRTHKSGEVVNQHQRDQTFVLSEVAKCLPQLQ